MMNNNMRETKSSRPIDNILAVFEPQGKNKKSDKGIHCQNQKEHRPQSKPLQDRIEVYEHKKTCRKERRQKSKNLQERIEAYERANNSSHLKVSKRSNADLEGLRFDDLMTRKASLLNDSFDKLFPSRRGSFDLDDIVFEDLPTRKKSLSESFASMEYHPMSLRSEAEDRVGSKPKPVRQGRRFRAQRRASTQCLRVWEGQKAWECNFGYATQVLPSQPNSVTGAVETIPTKERPGLQRRHSTGCLGHMDIDQETSTDFWQVYEQEVDVEPVKPLKESFAQKRGVRFAQHVTVWVFSKDMTYEHNSDLPTSFRRRSSKRDNQKKKLLSEDRFCSGKGSDAPKMPTRNRQPSLTQTSITCDDGAVSLPPRQPELRAPKQPQRHVTNEETLRAIVEDLTASPRRPVRHPSITDVSTPPPGEKNKLLIVDLCSSPRKPERKPTLHDPDSSFKWPKRNHKNHDSQKSCGGLFGVWNESRGSKASKATYMYDSFADDCSQTSDCSHSTSSSSDIQSIDSDMFSVESSPSAQYVVEIAKPKNVVLDSEECRRERAMMWHRRWGKNQLNVNLKYTGLRMFLTHSLPFLVDWQQCRLVK
jgi:hypothetical protein